MQNGAIVLEIFDFLKQQKLVDTEHRFSEQWLGQNESYLRRARYAGKEPSLGVVAIIGSRLQSIGSRLINTPHSEIGQQFLEFSEKCHRLVNQNLTDDLMNKFE